VYVLLGVPLCLGAADLLIGGLFARPAAMLTAGVGNTLGLVVVYYFVGGTRQGRQFCGAREAKLPIGPGQNACRFACS
jgi:hypothetical protein